MQHSEFIKHLTVLLVDDDLMTREFVGKKFKGIFKEIIIADNGAYGLKMFQKGGIDIVITDHLMPKMNGLEMAKEIRRKNLKIPIIMTSGFTDKNALIEAMNIGITQFLPKPFTYDDLIDAVDITMEKMLSEEFEGKVKDQQLQTLKYQASYHCMQQEVAMQKELNIIKNDFYLREINVSTDKNETKWFPDAYYVPLDILSGDSYSIRNVGDGKVLLFVADAMGKGLSAFVTTILAASFMNYFIDEIKGKGKYSFDFKLLLHSFTQFIRKELVSDEVLCASFLYLDLEMEAMDVAMFSMLPILIHTTANTIIKIESNNMPIMKYVKEIKIDRHDISKSKKILIYSDGLMEYAKSSDCLSVPIDCLKDDFKDATHCRDLYLKFRKRVDISEDDITFIFLNRTAHKIAWTEEFVIDARLSEISKLTDKIENLLKSKGIKRQDSAQIITAFSEIVMNAYEHGSLYIRTSLKNIFIKNGQYDEYLLNAERDLDKKITVTISLSDEDSGKFIIITVSDEGRGFDPPEKLKSSRHLQSLSGNGIKIVENIVDVIFYNEKGNKATLIKKVTLEP